MRILIHTADRDVFVYDAFPRRLIKELVDRLIAQLGITSDEDPGHKFHGNQWTGGLGAAPEAVTVKGVKAGVAQLLSSGHAFTLSDLQTATGAKLKQQILNAILELKKTTPAGGLVIVKDPSGFYKLELSKGLPAAETPAKAPEATPAPIVAPEAVPGPSPAVPKTYGLWGKAGEAMKAPASPLTKTEADTKYNEKIASTLKVINIAAGSSDTEEHLQNLAMIWKESKAQAMAQWKADTTGMDVMSKAQTVFKADLQLVKDLKEAGGSIIQQQVLAVWKKNSAGEKAGTWPPNPFEAALAAEKVAAEKAKKEAMFATMVHTTPFFPTIADYSPKGHAHIGVDDFIAGEATGKSKFEKGISQLKTALADDHKDAVNNKVSVQKSLEERLASSKSFQALKTQRMASGHSGSLEASLISAWAGSSGDHQPVSVANQLSIRDAFEMPHDSVATDALHLITKSGASENDVFAQAASTLGCKYETDEFRATFKAGLRDFALAQYHETQAHFAKLGISEVYVARGMKVNLAEHKAQHGKLRLQPASSFSAKVETAAGFAGGGTLYTVKVPVSQVLSTYVTGFGCTGEHELVVLAHPDTEAIRMKSSYAGSATQIADHVRLTLGGKTASEVALQNYEKAKASAQSSSIKVTGVPPIPNGVHHGKAAEAKIAAEFGNLAELQEMKKNVGTNKPKTKKYINELIAHVQAQKPATSEGVKKNAHYYKKLKEKIESHPMHDPESFKILKGLGKTNEQVLAEYHAMVAT